MYICLCRGVTDVQIQNAIENGCDSYAKLRQELQVASQCGRCACEIKKMVNSAEQNLTNIMFQSYDLAYECV